MKKTIILLLTLIIIFSTLVGCGKEEEEPKSYAYAYVTGSQGTVAVPMLLFADASERIQHFTLSEQEPEYVILVFCSKCGKEEEIQVTEPGLIMVHCDCEGEDIQEGVMVYACISFSDMK